MQIYIQAATRAVELFETVKGATDNADDIELT